MCRLFGLVANTPVGIRYWMRESPHPFGDWSGEHSHGWGIGWHGQGGPMVVKEPHPAKESPKFVETAATASSRIFVCHLRKGTCGEHSYENTHPFSYGSWLFAHNGTIDGDYFRSKLIQKHRDALIGDTDSEVYFHWLLQSLEAGGVDGLRSGIEEVSRREFTALNFILSDGHTLYAYWEQSPKAEPLYPDYYQLRYAIRSDSQIGARQVVICSERLDDELWVDIPQAALFSTTRDLEVATAPL